MVNLEKFNNDWYDPGRGKVIRLLWYIVNSLLFNSYLLPLSFLKSQILKAFGAKVGKKIVIKPKVNIKYPWKLEIGDFSWIGENVWIDNLDQVKIGEHVCVSQGALLLCGNHDYKKITFDLITKPIILKNGCWVGAKTIVCPGTVIEENTLLTVGSVAIGRLESNAIYQGNPSKKIKERIIQTENIPEPSLLA